MPEDPSQNKPLDIENQPGIETSGGSYIGGNVDTGGGTFIGRDQVIINITTSLVGAAEAQDIEATPPEPGDPPFQGLQYFSEDDADRFFGREVLTSRIIARLHRERFLTVIGASGSGKSSLIRAGVIPSLRRGERIAEGVLPPTDSQRWAVLTFSPSAHPLDTLAAILSAPDAPLSKIESLRDELAGNPGRLALAARKYLAQGGQPHLFLFIDQFEEVFTLCRRQEEREAFLACLLEAVGGEDQGPITVLIALRADFYADVARHDRLRQAVSQHQEFIGAMTREELVRAIDRPLALGEWKIQEGLIQVILDDIGYEPGALPLLSHALHETWLRRRGRTLTLSGYKESGGVRGAVAQSAEAVFRGLPPAHQLVARMIFLRMAEIGEDSQDTRRKATYAELITRSTDKLVIDTVIDILASARLVITSEEKLKFRAERGTLGMAEYPGRGSPDGSHGASDPGTPGPSAVPGGENEGLESTWVVEVAHEALIREWPTLREWLEEDREGLILHQRLTENALDWIKMAHDPGLLYRGARLEKALDWAAANPDALCLPDQEFLEASQREAQRLARATRLQRILIGLSAALVLVLAYLIYYNYQINRTPAVMNGFYNIAVAEFGSQDSPDSEDIDIDQAIYETLQAEGQENSFLNLLIWHDGPEIRKLNVIIGPVLEEDPAARLNAAADLAERLNADMVIYGADNGALEFFLAPSQDYNYEDIQGGFVLNCSTPSDETGVDSSESDPNQQALASCANALASIGVGLAEAQLGLSVEALEALMRADRSYPNSEVIQFLIGREALFLTERESVLAFGLDYFDAQAEQAFKRSIEIAPDYPRAFIGLGSVYSKRARRLIPESPPWGPAPPEALQYANQALDAYQRAFDLSSNLPDGGITEYGIPVDSVARLGLGNTLRLIGQISYGQGDSTSALEHFDQAIETLKSAVEPLQSNDQARYLTQAYENLGNVFEVKAYIYVSELDYRNGLPAYRLALEHYDRCIAQAESTQDLIIKDEIVPRICLPGRDRVKEYLDRLGGT